MKHTIVLIEDDEDTREIITIILQLEGFTIITTKVETYLDIVQTSLPSLIICDFMLGGSINGAEVCNQLKSNQHTFNIPFLLISAVNGLPAIALGCRAEGYIEKPFDIEHMVERVRSAIA